MTFPHGNHKTLWIELVLESPSFLVDVPEFSWLQKPESHSTSLGGPSKDTGQAWCAPFLSAHCNALHGTSVLQPAYLLPCLVHLADVWVLTLGSPSEECGLITLTQETLSSCPPPSVLTVYTASLCHLHTPASLRFTTEKIQVPDTWKQVLNWFVNPNVSGK